MLSLLWLGIYSIYVATYTPDPQETVILGQTKIAAGSPAALRVLVRNRVTGRPVTGAQVELTLEGKPHVFVKLGSFHTDTAGSVADAVDIPDLPPGDYDLVIDASSSLGRDHVVKKVEVQQPARILLSSDKPIYQPGQIIHLRSLALNERTQKPFANQPVTFEVSDSQGNKVFKETHQSSAFGIASADFVLATELNQGRFAISASSGAATTEHNVEVKRYVLPKFKIAITTDNPYYLAGPDGFRYRQSGLLFRETRGQWRGEIVRVNASGKAGAGDRVERKNRWNRNLYFPICAAGFLRRPARKITDRRSWISPRRFMTRASMWNKSPCRFPSHRTN